MLTTYTQQFQMSDETMTQTKNILCWILLHRCAWECEAPPITRRGHYSYSNQEEFVTRLLFSFSSCWQLYFWQWRDVWQICGPPAIPEQSSRQRVVLPGAAAQSSLALYGHCVNPLKVHSPAAATRQSRATGRTDRGDEKEKEKTTGSEEGKCSWVML